MAARTGESGGKSRYLLLEVMFFFLGVGGVVRT